MMQQLRFIQMADFSEWFPAFLILVLIPLTGSIATGLAFGFIAYPLAKIAVKATQDVTPIMWVLSFLFLLDLVANTFLS